MADLKELFDAVTTKAPVQPDPLERQLREQRRRASSRRIGAYAVAAVIALLAVVVLSNVARDDAGAPADESAVTVTPPVVDPQSAEVIGLDGRTIERFGSFPQDAFALTLAPDGQTIAYVTTETPGVDRITVRSGGIDEAILPGGVTGSFPAWSPDGSRIAFQGHLTGRGGEDDIYVVNADGSGLRRLTTDPFRDSWPAWSPDGSTIVYVNDGRRPADTSGNTPTSTLWTVPADGGTPTKVPVGRAGITNPDYSPDGRRIAFSGDGVWTVDAAGGEPRRVAAISGVPRWSPDGSTIALLDYDDSWRATIDIFGSIVDVPVMDVALLDLDSGTISTIDGVEVATVSNAPRWLSSGDGLFVFRVFDDTP
jgi:dipeptidyl aminopeptidase/acylaminoacyl peptidase